MADATIRTILVMIATVALLKNLYSHSTYAASGHPSRQRGTANKTLNQPFIIECHHDHIQRYEIKTKGDIAVFAKKCKDPDMIRLVGEKTLPTQGLSVKEFLSLIRAPVLEMCLLVEMSTIRELDFSHIIRITGSCGGPRLVVAQNLNLKEVKFSDYFMETSRANSVVIRGNPMLEKTAIDRMKNKFRPGAIDLQEFGECAPPLPLSSFAKLAGCKKLFGVLSVDGNVNYIARVSNMSLEFQGCLHIVKTKISNVDFLDGISTFIRSPYHAECAHEIADNSKLCIRNPQRLRRKFKGLLVYQSSKCETVCSGGLVNENYLAATEGCKTIDGDLIFFNLSNPKSSFESLNSIERIYGTLEISMCSGLGSFHAFESLKEITVFEGKREPAIRIVGNRGLSSLDFPELSRIKSSDNIKIRIARNPSLTMKKALVEKMYEMAGGKSHAQIEYTDSTTFAERFPEILLWILVVILILLIILTALCIACIVLVPYYLERRSKNKFGFPLPPWKVNKKSKEILAGWVKDIAEKNPLIWRCSDRDVIWAHAPFEGAHNDIQVIVANNEFFLKEHMLPLAPNGRIGESDKFLLCERMKAFLQKEVIIMIGSAKHPSGVFPYLPEVVSGTYTYKYLGTIHFCTLMKIKSMAPNTTEYTYDVVTMEKDKKPVNKMLKVFYHIWSDGENPKEYDEILQLARVYEPSKTLCSSDRRKEVFSLIHLFHIFCMELQEPISFADALQLHTEKCNGAVLDRSELGYVMAVLMEWAYQSRSVTPELKKKHMEWCHSYAIMDRFMRKHKNIKWIHPDYLLKLDSNTRHSVLVDGFMSSPRFSERESAAIQDPFHKKDAEGLQIYKKEPKKKNTDSEDDDEGEAAAGDDVEFWSSKKRSGSKADDVKVSSKTSGSISTHGESRSVTKKHPKDGMSVSLAPSRKGEEPVLKSVALF